jgi:hypothetical protein
MQGITAEGLVTLGLLPENMPPMYTTKTLWAPLQALSEQYSVTSKCVGDSTIYNSSKRGNQRRAFSLPHPLFIKDAGIFFHRHSHEIEALFAESYGSASRPQANVGSGRAVLITAHRHLPQTRLQKLAKYKYTLVIDISRFFPSIYSHAIPWALNGRAQAKNDQKHDSITVFGNRLDFIIRQLQSKQTIGIPVGPDSSKIVSEIIASAVDKRFIELSGRNKPIYVRHADDYWIGGKSRSECEGHLNNLRTALK